MPRAIRPAHFKIFISSPGDVAEERRIALDVLQQIPREPAWKGVVTIDSVAYDDPHAGIGLDAGLPPQQSVERRERASACDLTIVILWGGMGTAVESPRRPDGSQYASGTEREFEDAKSAGKPILLYRRMPPPPIDIEDPQLDEKRKQRELVKAFFERLNTTGAGGSHVYKSADEFRSLLKQHVEGELRRLLEAPKKEKTSTKKSQPKKPKTSRAAAPTAIPPAYLAWLKERCASVELLGLRLKHGQAVRLNNVYVPLVTTKPAEDEGRKAERLASWPVEPQMLLLDRLGRESLYVPGDPGSGKSTFCRWLAWLACEGAIPTQDVDASPRHTEQFDASLAGRLPLLITLRDFWSALPDPALTPPRLSIRELTTCLSHWLIDRRAPELTEELIAAHFERGTALLVLDGVDEVPQRHRALLIETLADARAVWVQRGNRLLVTSRPYGLSNDEVLRLGLASAPIDPLPADLQQLLVRRWFRILADTADAADTTADELLQQARRQEWLVPLMSNPLLLTAMCIIFGEGKRLPEDKYELYDRIVDTVLHSRIADRGRLQLVRARLSVVAYAMHTGDAIDEAPRVTPQAQITEAEIDRALRIYQERSGWTERHVRGSIEDREELLTQTGLLLPREAHQAAFFHLSIQEFLAAQRIADIDVGRLRDVFCNRSTRPEWRNTLSFLFGSLLATNTTPERAVRVLTDVIIQAATNDHGLQLVAFDCVEILKRRGIALPKEVERSLTVGLLHTMREAAEAGIRCQAGTALGQIGDPRFRADMWHLPDDDQLGFVEIPAGSFAMGSTAADEDAYEDEKPQHEVTLPSFFISKWPVTVAQFRAFLDFGHEDDGARPPTAPMPWSTHPNHPVDDASWDEAIAYCRWLTDRLRTSDKTPERLRWLLLGRGARAWNVTLPSEAEWERAARGTDARIYPWGNEPDVDRANYAETGIGQASAVGCFPRGAREGIEDLAGNVWQWTRSLWKVGERNVYRYPYRPDYAGRHIERLDLGRRAPETRRAIRGGNYFVELKRIRAAYRDYSSGPAFSAGFRVVISPFHSAPRAHEQESSEKAG